MYPIRHEANDKIYHSESENDPRNQDHDVMQPLQPLQQQITDEINGHVLADDVRYFGVEEVGDLLKSRKNLVYMFRLSGCITRILSSSRQDVYSDLLEGRACQQKELDESE